MEAQAKGAVAHPGDVVEATVTTAEEGNVPAGPGNCNDDRGSGDQSRGGDATELETLRLRLEIAKVELEAARVKAQGSNNEQARGQMSQSAADLKAVLAPMPCLDAAVPAWFRTVDTLFTSFRIPASIQGPLILPFLTERMRSFVASQMVGSPFEYEDIKKKILKELRLTPSAFRKAFTTAVKTGDET